MGNKGGKRKRLVFYPHRYAGVCADLPDGTRRQKLTNAEAMSVLADWLTGVTE